MENFENNRNRSLEIELRQLEDEIAAIEALHPTERNDVELIEKLRELKQRAAQIKVDLTNP
ncbi:MAG: hypothetical protein KBC35_02350 [Candidatus Pacebacteria bacterium]|jgi:hypothetical protein|nr:hypothetical protein [Candidatus Paceibacterota bacterium]